MSCIGVASAAPKDTYKTVDIGQTHVNVANVVSGNMIGWWPTTDVSGVPSKTLLIADKKAFDITAADFAGYTGFWYNINSPSGPGLDKALEVDDTWKTVDIGQTGVNVAKAVSGTMIGWWPTTDVSMPPSKTITIPDKRSFDITATDFVGYTGFWYNINSPAGPGLDKALEVVDRYKSVDIWQNNVNVAKFVSGDTIGWWPTTDVSMAPSRTIAIPDKRSFDITATDFVGYTGFWYNLNSPSGPGLDKALEADDTWKTVYIGQTHVNVANAVSGNTIGWWEHPEDVYSMPPTTIVAIADKKNFDVAPLSGFLGFWYNLDSGQARDIALEVVDSYKTVYIGQTRVNVADFVSGDTIGWWASPDDVYSTSPSRTITIANKKAFDITAADFAGYTGFWYNMVSGYPRDKALDVEVSV